MKIYHLMIIEKRKHIKSGSFLSPTELRKSFILKAREVSFRFVIRTWSALLCKRAIYRIFEFWHNWLAEFLMIYLIYSRSNNYIGQDLVNIDYSRDYDFYSCCWDLNISETSYLQNSTKYKCLILSSQLRLIYKLQGQVFFS